MSQLLEEMEMREEPEELGSGDKGHRRKVTKKGNQALEWTGTDDKLSSAASHQGWVTYLGRRAWVWRAQPHLRMESEAAPSRS